MGSRLAAYVPCPLRHSTVLPRGWDGLHSCKHLPTHTLRGQESGSPSTLGIPRLWGQADGATQICQPRGKVCTASTRHGSARLAAEGHTEQPPCHISRDRRKWRPRASRSSLKCSGYNHTVWETATCSPGAAQALLPPSNAHPHSRMESGDQGGLGTPKDTRERFHLARKRRSRGQRRGKDPRMVMGKGGSPTADARD